MTKNVKLLVYIISILLYIYFVLSNRRDYQDSYILQDIVLPTSIFIFVFVAVVVLTNDNRIIALICSSFVVVMNSVPAMKYELFYGIPDVTFHYRLVYEIMNSGYVPKDTVYSGTPGLHIFISLFSLILGISANTGFKYTIPILFGSYPLIIYFISNKLIQNGLLRKYVVIASAFPLIAAYYLVGTIFPLLFLILLGPLIIIGLDAQNEFKYRIILIIMLLALLISHTVTSLLFILFTAGAIILLALYDTCRHRDIFSFLVKRSYIMLFFAVVLYISWWMYESGYLFSIFANTGVKTIEHIFTTFEKEPIPQRFFDIPFINKIQILSIYYMTDFIIAILSIYGMFLFFRERKNIILYSYLISFLVVIFLILILNLTVKFGDMEQTEYYRFIDYGIMFSPFFVGLSFYKLRMKKTNFKIIEILIIFMVISVSLIQFFPYQPLTPRASIINKNMSGEEPLMYFHHVNTIYQKDMISFASNFSSNKTIIAADTFTRLQLISFFDRPFEDIISTNSTLLYNSPLEKGSDRWNLFLIHWNGKSGAFQERAEYRSNEMISKNRNSKNVVYDNGESFIIQNSEYSY